MTTVSIRSTLADTEAVATPTGWTLLVCNKGALFGLQLAAAVQSG